MYIEGILLYHFSASKHTETEKIPQAGTRHDVFHSFLYHKRKQDYVTTIAHNKYIIRFLNQCNIISTT